MPHNDKEDLLTKTLIVELLLEEIIKHEQVFYFLVITMSILGFVITEIISNEFNYGLVFIATSLIISSSFFIKGWIK